ncbi:hypothetical protein [Agarivorans sp. DSG3-1]
MNNFTDLPLAKWVSIIDDYRHAKTNFHRHRIVITWCLMQLRSLV